MREDYLSVANVMAETGIPADELIRRIRAGELGGEKRQNEWFVKAPSSDYEYLGLRRRKEPGLRVFEAEDGSDLRTQAREGRGIRPETGPSDLSSSVRRGNGDGADVH